MSVLADIYKRLFAPKSHTHTKDEITGLGSIIGWPNYTKPTTITSGYVATKNGYIVWNTHTSPEAYIKFTIGGTTIQVARVGDSGSEEEYTGGGVIPITSGTTVTFERIDTIQFVPCL